jgi:hypothetical protein
LTEIKAIVDPFDAQSRSCGRGVIPIPRRSDRLQQDVMRIVGIGSRRSRTDVFSRRSPPWRAWLQARPEV